MRSVCHFQKPTPRQYDPVNSTNTTPKTTTPYQNDKANGEQEKISEQCIEMYKSTSQQNHNQQRPTTHDQTHNTTTHTTRRDSTTNIIKITMVQKNTRSLTSDDKIHELIQELCHDQRDVEKAERIVDDATRTHQRNGNTHPQEMDQTHQGSAAFWAETHRSLRREKKFRLQVSSVSLPTHGQVAYPNVLQPKSTTS